MIPRAISIGSLITKHGFPSGVRFVPTEMELVSILSDRVSGVPLPPRVAAVFHDVDILDYHPKDLHEMYRQDTEYRYIYFFSCRRFPAPPQAGEGGEAAFFPEDERQMEPRPVRVAKGGGWKPSGGARPLRLPPRQGGFVVGKMVSMVFYDDDVQGGAAGKGKKNQVKSDWGMHEVTVPVKRELTDIEPNTRFYNLALYRLYVLKSGDVETENRTAAAGTAKNVVSDNSLPASSSSTAAVVPCPAPQPPPPRPPLRISTANQTLAVGASTSSTPPPPPPPQRRLISAPHQQRAHYYHLQHASFGPAQQQQQLHTTMSPAMHGSVRQPAHLLPLMAPPPGPLPHGAGQQFGYFGGGVFTRSPYLAPLPMSTPTLLPANNVSPPPPVEQMAPAGRDTLAASRFGVTPLPPAAPSGSSRSEQHDASATTTEPIAEEVPPPPPEDFVPAAQDNEDIYDVLPDLWNPNLMFTMEELTGEKASDEPTPPMHGDN